jgi:malonyl CoA-acyl carrier protein transacylase
MSQVLHFKYINQAELIKEDYLIGHSIGEYSALCIAKSISLE